MDHRNIEPLGDDDKDALAAILIVLVGVIIVTLIYVYRPEVYATVYAVMTTITTQLRNLFS